MIANLGCERKKTSLKTDEEKYSYAIGYQFAKNLKGQSVDIDAQSLTLAVDDVIANKDPRIPEEEMQKAMQTMYEKRREKVKAEGEANLEKGKKFLEENKGKEGVKVTASGLQYKVIKEGEGKKPKDSDIVKVHYKGTLIDGTEFDSSYARNEPAEFPVKAVIPGWTEALQMMKEGSKYQLFIPTELAYGERGRPSIPPNSVLVFEVELLEVKPEAKGK
ncbi:MAG: FKBP-type peptidyl-prolyl cis-trans isomerase [Bdellovibrionales bacterium]|nr:FKBP-type peptidyl-prolyl cis-trans isomerase [Bdellovibrionales bacterium]